ncbi:MAG: hypothetical protein V4619_15475 [Bacteroidota bacterium]
MKDYRTEFQTPPDVCRYMASMIPDLAKTVMEPTKGIGNLFRAISDCGFQVDAPDDYFLRDKKKRYDCVVLNPPFSSKYLIMDNCPKTFTDRGMNAGYRILFECMQQSDHLIALMPWFTLSDSDVRLRYLKNYGLKSVTSLPRRTFEYARIQTCVIELIKGYGGPTEFLVYDLMPAVESNLQKSQGKIEFSLV